LAKIERFEDLEVWQKARELVKDIYMLTDNRRFSRDLGLKNQIRRAAISILSNISEGFEREGNKEFTQFLYIAKGSRGDVRAQLYIARDQNYVNGELFRKLTQQAINVSKIHAGFIPYLKQSSYNGVKHKS